jgi:pseudouridine-5'-monophosphatase
VSAVQAVIFDLDGLLVDSEPLQLRAWEQSLARFGVVLSDEVLAQMYGRRLHDAAVAVVDAFALPTTPEALALERDALFLSQVPGAVPAMPGARELVEALRSREISIALATSGHRRYADLALASAGLVGLFEVEITGEMVERGKPEPDTFLLAAERLAVPTNHCLVLEDSPNGLEAAKRAGMRCIVIPLPDMRKTSFEGADAILGSLRDVLPRLERYGIAPRTASHG